MIKLILLFFFCQSALGKVERISEKEMDTSKTMVVHITPGRSTLIDFPCEISHSILGLHGDIKTTIGPDSKSTMSVWASGDSSEPTNLTVRCDDEIFVFDIYPNSHTHQDYINIVSYFDNRLRESKKLINSSDRAAAEKDYEGKKIVSSSKSNERHRTKKLISKGQKK